MGDRLSLIRRLAWPLLLCIGLAGACKNSTPKPPAPVAEPPQPPPPPPKTCDTIEDKCTATADTRAPIQTSGWSLAPPPDWTYAHEADALVAKTEAASIGVIFHETGAKKKVQAKRAEALDLVTRKLGLTAPKTLVWPTKPGKLVAVGDLKVALYQFGGFKREDKPGAVLVFTSPLSDTKSLLGVGFVLESDTHDADRAILTCIQSLRAAPPVGVHDAGPP
jgi:hypothetical protein